MSNNIGLYIHIPFCKSKCYYCNFTSINTDEKYMSDYIDTLISELSYYSKMYGLNYDTVFIGGGTPSYLSINNLEKLLFNINKHANKITEFSIECNPESITQAKINLFENYNVNRISIGLQSTNNNTLSRIGRVHTYEDFLKSYNIIKKSKIDNINLDIIHSLPNETYQDNIDTINQVIELNPTHVSVYSLSIEKGTKFYKEFNENMYVNEELDRKIHKGLVTTLKEKGYYRYEISNFAKNNYECKHSLKYWSREEYLGIGVSAHSFIGKKRFSNTDDIDLYQKNINKKKYAIDCSYEIINEDESLFEFIMLNLRLSKGINIDKVNKIYNIDFLNKYKSVIQNSINSNGLRIDNGRIFLTDYGFDISNEIISNFYNF